MLGQIVAVFIQFFFLLTPFFLVSSFLSLTPGKTDEERNQIARRVVIALVVVGFILYFLGNPIFRIMGITVDAFRVGAGALLFLSAVDLVRGKPLPTQQEEEGDIALVPLAMPIAIGPATTGAILVMGSQYTTLEEHVVGCTGLFLALLSVGSMLFLAGHLERLIGRERLYMMTKVTGLILSAMSAQLMALGLRAIFFPH